MNLTTNRGSAERALPSLALLKVLRLNRPKRIYARRRIFVVKKRPKARIVGVFIALRESTNITNISDRNNYRNSKTTWEHSGARDTIKIPVDFAGRMRVNSSSQDGRHFFFFLNG